MKKRMKRLAALSMAVLMAAFDGGLRRLRWRQR